MKEVKNIEGQTQKLYKEGIFDRLNHYMKRVGAAGLVAGALALGPMGCDEVDGGCDYDLPPAAISQFQPAVGTYTFSSRGCFCVSEGGQSILFASDCFRYDTIRVINGRFMNEWGEIGWCGSHHCPTDGYGISGVFVSPTRAEGVIKYANGCSILSDFNFVAEFKDAEVDCNPFK